jgi:hypothetical protein
MKQNVGKTDAGVRLIVGFLVLLAGYSYATWWGLLGLLILASAILRFSLIYKLLGISTAEKMPKAAKKVGKKKRR